MRISVEISQPRWLASRPRLRKGIFVAAILGLFVIPGTVIASHQFADVPDSQPFHTEIGAIKDAGITSGSTECGGPPPGQTFYCPESLVRRDAMAAFMHRGYGRAGLGEDEASNVEADGFLTTGASVVMETGGVAGGTAFVMVNASIRAEQLGGGQPCPCNITMFIRMTDPGGANPVTSSSVAEYIAEDPASPAGTNLSNGTASQTWVFSVPTGATKEFSVQYSLTGDLTGTDTTVTSVQTTISALYVPFSNDGDNTLAEG